MFATFWLANPLHKSLGFVEPKLNLFFEVNVLPYPIHRWRNTIDG